MPIFVVQQLNFGVSKVDSFTSRGLSTSTSSTVRDADIVLFGPKDLARCFAAACQEDFSSAIGGGRSKVVNDIIPQPNNGLRFFDTVGMRVPTVVVISKDLTREIAGSMGLIQLDKADHYAGTLTPDVFAELMNQQQNPYVMTPAGNTNLAGYAAWTWAVRGVKQFVSFIERRGAAEVWVGDGVVKSKMLTLGEKEVEKVMKKAPKDEKDPSFGLWSTVGDNSRSIRILTGNLLNVKSGFAAEASNYKAEGCGYLFEYFPGMMNGDPNYVFDIFMQYFGNSISADTETVKQTLMMMRKGCRSLCNTQAGLELQHMYLGISMGMRGGNVKYLTDEAQYCGFCYYPYSTSQILVRNITRPPYEAESLQLEIESLATHKRSISAIATILENL